MFTTKDFSVIPRDYFIILNQGAFSVTLQSKCTKHCWHLIPYGAGYDLMHKHHMEDKYHYQTSFGNLFDAILDIVDHDEYQLRGRKPVKHEWELKNSYFDVLIKEYGLT